MADLVLAVEGPCCAGKTTLTKGIRTELLDWKIAFVRDFSDFAGGGRFMPSPIPMTRAEEVAGLEFFLDLERRRYEECSNEDLDAFWADRSIHTILAHSYSLQRLNGGGYFDLTLDMVKSADCVYWPDRVYYLDISNKVARARNNGKFPSDSVFVDVEFNAGFREYFVGGNRYGLNSIVILNGQLARSTVLSEGFKNSVKILRDGGRLL